MKKIIAVTLLLAIAWRVCNAQDLKLKSDSISTDWRDSIVHALDRVKQDTSRVLLIAELASYYKFNFPDSSLFYGYKALAFARQIKFPKGEVLALGITALAELTLGNDSKALQLNLQGLKIAEKNNLMFENTILMGVLGQIYNGVKNHTRALDILRKSKLLFDSLHEPIYSAWSQDAIGKTYLMLNQPDSALYYCQSAYKNAVPLKEKAGWVAYDALLNLGKIQNKKGSPDTAMAYFRQSLRQAGEADNFFNSYFSIAQLYQKLNKPDSCIYYAKKSLELIQGKGFYSHIVDANVLLSAIYEKRDPQKALEYSKIAIAYKDSLYNLGKTTSFENFTAFDEQERQYEIETAKTSYRNKVKQYGLITGLLVFLLIAYILYRNNRHKQKAYTLLQKQKQEIDFQKAKAEQTLQELKSTQAQLIQSEKMASLGELTAGIAHEIQNPLNFVNNFSEVNKELIEEVKSQKSKLKSQELDELLNNIANNEEKISHHGKRADTIVKGMLQHSRIATGQKEPTNINALADEYLRLAYHGMRAKDKSFSAEIKTDFDESIGRISIVPQDIGRVLLNLYNNAFYAVNEKRKTADENYQPSISVSTKKVNDRSDSYRVEIRVKDNGGGIPQKIVDKIFQPFFTTKPTGQGTGLGLSLSYDIIKAHGGEIKVETKEGQGTEFIIELPFASL